MTSPASSVEPAKTTSHLKSEYIRRLSFKRAERPAFRLRVIGHYAIIKPAYVNFYVWSSLMKKEKVKFYVERSSFGVQAMIILMALSAVFRIIGCWGMWNDHNYALTQIALPILSALLMILCVWLLGGKALWLSFVPVFLGVVFFIIKAVDFENRIHMILCIFLYIAVASLYFCTVFGIIKTKWILTPLFGLPFLYHIFVEDLTALRDTANPVTFSAGMQEMGILCIMLGLFFLSISIKKQVKEQEVKLPKIKAPKVVPVSQTTISDNAEINVAGSEGDGSAEISSTVENLSTATEQAVQNEQTEKRTGR